MLLLIHVLMLTTCLIEVLLLHGEGGNGKRTATNLLRDFLLVN